MNKQELLENKWIHVGVLAVLIGSLVAYFMTYSYAFLLLPFAFLLAFTTILNWKLVYWLFLFSIPASIQLYLLGTSLSTSLPDEPMMWMFLLLFAMLYANNPKILPEWWWRNPIVLIVVLQLLWLIVPVIFSYETLFSVKFFLAKSWFLVSFFVLPIFVFKKKKDFKTGFWLLLVPMFITMLIIMYRHKSYSFNFRKIEESISPIYYNHVEYSTVISMFFPVVYIAFLLTKWKNIWMKLGLLFVVLFFLPAIYLTYARAAMLAVIFAFMVNIAVRLRLVNLIMPVFYAAIIALLFFLSGNNKYIDFRPNYERTYMHNSFTDHMIATFKGTDMSSMERVYRWIAAIRMSEKRPITGYGPNSFYYYYKPYAVSMFRTYVSRNTEHSTTHNYFIFMLVGQGWPAMLLYAILIMVVFAQGQKIYHRFKDPFYKKVTIGMLMMFAAGFINNFFSELLETHKVGALFYLAMALLVVLDRKSKEEKTKESNTTLSA